MSRETGFAPEVAEDIWIRDRGSCVRCGRGLIRARRGEDWAIHHREPRGRGGAGKRRWWANRAANGIVLCTACHEWVEGNRKTATFDGYLVSALGVRRPAQMPVLHALYGRVRLDNEGGWELAA